MCRVKLLARRLCLRHSSSICGSNFRRNESRLRRERTIGGTCLRPFGVCLHAFRFPRRRRAVETGAFEADDVPHLPSFVPRRHNLPSHQTRWLWSNKKTCLHSSVTSRRRRHGRPVSRDPAESGEVSGLKRDARASRRLTQCPAKVTPAIQHHLHSGAKRVWYSGRTSSPAGKASAGKLQSLTFGASHLACLGQTLPAPCFSLPSIPRMSATWTSLNGLDSLNCQPRKRSRFGGSQHPLPVIRVILRLACPWLWVNLHRESVI